MEIPVVLGQEILAGNFGIVEPVRGERGAGAGIGGVIPVLHRMAWRIRVREDGEMILVVQLDNDVVLNNINVQGDGDNNVNHNIDVP